MSVSTDKLKQLIRDGVREVLHEQFPEEPRQPHDFKISEHVSECPDCYKGVFEELNKTSDYRCKDCGLPLGKKELAEKIKVCPNCGSEDAEEIEREEEG